jgi:hypothetical protein
MVVHPIEPDGEERMTTKTYSTKSNAKAAAQRAGEENPVLTELEGGRWTWAGPDIPASVKNGQTLPVSEKWIRPAVDPDLLQLARNQGPIVALTALMGAHQISEVHTAARDAMLIAYALGVETAAKVRREPRAARNGAPSKREIAADLLRRPEGATSREILDATGWPTVSIPALAKASKLALRQQKDGKVTRYYGEAA